MADQDKVVDLAPRGAPLLRCNGVIRPIDEPRALTFFFDRRPTDAELRFLHDVMDRAAIMARGSA